MVDRRIEQLNTEPVYNIKAVVQQTGVPADTVRAWERRYGLPMPQRTETKRRLYSEYDIATIRWLRERTSAGLTISQAVRQFQSLDPTALQGALPNTYAEPRTPEQVMADLLTALLAFDETSATKIVEEAVALYAVEVVCLEVFAPLLHEIGNRWHDHNATVAHEHFAANFILRRLAMLFQVYSATATRGLIVAACAPEELHELGILTLSVFLARHGWRVVYLGANLPLDSLLLTCAQLEPAVVCLSATNIHTAHTLIAAAVELNKLPEPRPVVAFGGAPFNASPQLRSRVPGQFLGLDARESMVVIEQLLRQPR